MGLEVENFPGSLRSCIPGRLLDIVAMRELAPLLTRDKVGTNVPAQFKDRFLSRVVKLDCWRAGSYTAAALGLSQSRFQQS